MVSLLDGLKNAGYQVDGDIQKAYIEYAPKAKANLPKPKNPLEAFLPGHFIPEMSLAELNSVCCRQKQRYGNHHYW